MVLRKISPDCLSNSPHRTEVGHKQLTVRATPPSDSIGGKMTMIHAQPCGLIPFRILCVLTVALVVIGLMTVDISSEAEPSWMEKRLASTFLDMKVRLKAPTRSSPLKSVNEDLEIESGIYRSASRQIVLSTPPAVCNQPFPAAGLDECLRNSTWNSLDRNASLPELVGSECLAGGHVFGNTGQGERTAMNCPNACRFSGCIDCCQPQERFTF